MTSYPAPRAAYAFSIHNGVVCIVDYDNGRSVTNDAEAVIADLVDVGVDVAAMPVQGP